ncbi:MAG: CRISPR-associated endonuclease Cas2 [Thermodesulfobacteriota bacterium]
MAGSERLFVCCYDIRDPKRLVRVHRCLKQRGLALQYSVFVLEGSTEAALEALSAVAALIDPGEDDVRMYALPAGVEVEPLGATEVLPPGVVLVGGGGGVLLRAGRLPRKAGAAPDPGWRVEDS